MLLAKAFKLINQRIRPHTALNMRLASPRGLSTFIRVKSSFIPTLARMNVSKLVFAVCGHGVFSGEDLMFSTVAV